MVQPSWGTMASPGWTLVFSALPLLSSRRHCRFSTSALAYSTFTKPPSSLPHSHISALPSGSSKYFPSLLFEASMGHGTSCTNHAGPAEGWGGGGGGGWGWTEKHRNSICTVFAFFFFFAKAAITDQLLPNSQFKKLWLWMKALAAEFDHIPQMHQGEKGGRVNSEPDSLRWFNMGAGPKYIVLGLCWWMDHQIHLIVCSKT